MDYYLENGQQKVLCMWGHDVETIIGNAYSGFGFGGRNFARQQFKASAFIYKFSFAFQRTFGQFANLHKALIVGSSAMANSNMNSSNFK